MSAILTITFDILGSYRLPEEVTFNWNSGLMKNSTSFRHWVDSWQITHEKPHKFYKNKNRLIEKLVV